jgi:hypothetical protein
MRKRLEGGRTVEEPEMCEIKVRLKNPPDNRGSIGFKLKTYEVIGEGKK